MSPIRSTPISLFVRRHLPEWLKLASPDDPPGFTGDTGRVLEALTRQGALFFGELLKHRSLLPSKVEQALSELASQGWVTCDSFEGLRALLLPERKRASYVESHHHRRNREAVASLEFAGRWSLLRDTGSAREDSMEGEDLPNASRAHPLDSGSHAARTEPSPPSITMNAAAPRESAVETYARVLLRRYGLVFRRLLERESMHVSWYELGRVYRRLEARGEIRGGYFVAGVGGEQFALPEAVGVLRSIRKAPAPRELVVISGADPLNLAGILTPGKRIAAIASNRLLLRDGVPIAALEGREILNLEPEPKETEDLIERSLRIGSMSPSLRSYYA